VPKREKTRDKEIFKIGKSYYFRGTVNGIRINDKKLVGSSFTIAKANKDALKEDLERVGLAAMKSKCGKIFDDFVKHRKHELDLGDIRLSVYKEAEGIVRLHLKPFFEPYTLAEVEDKWIQYRLKKKHLDLSNHRKVLSTFLKWCRKKKLIKYVGELEYKTPKRKERINLTNEEIMQFVPYALTRKGHTPVIIAIALLMGPRGGEITNLTWDRVDFSDNVIILEDKDTKTKKPRVIPMPPYVEQRLKMIKADQEAQGIKTAYVFTNRKDPKRPMYKGGYIEQFERIRVWAGLKRHFTLHDLRATIEGRAVHDTSLSDKVREDFFGSSSEVQRKIYAKTNLEHLKKVLNVMQIEALDQILQSDLGGRIGESEQCGKLKGDSND
jgi:integrase